MTIGKRKGFTSKGAGAAPGNDSNKKVGGSLSKSDHFYLQESYGLTGDTGVGDTPMDASGGTVSDWADPGGNSYRTHVFTATGTFTVNAAATGSLPNDVDWAVIAGGASGGGHYGGGGGAGGFRSNMISPGGNAADPSPGGESAITVSTGQAYTITVGAGGATAPAHAGLQGGNSSISHPSITDIICNGGGGGGSLSPNPNYPYGPGIAGGSGGGGADRGSNPNAGGASSTPPGAPTITQGYAGGNLPNTPGGGGYEAAGGGGARYVGQGGTGGNPGAGGHGGIGINLADILGPTNTAVGYVGPSPTPSQWFAGGGGGGGYHSAGNQGGEGGTFPTGFPSPWCGAGGGGAWPTGAGSAALMNSGSGGGGVGPGDPHNPLGGHAGGSGIVMFRYKIGSVGGTKATGGLVSHTPTRTIHTFLETGTFTVTSPTLTSIQYLVIGGGGSGGVNLQYNQGSGGGGAGGLRTSFTGDVPGGPGGSTEAGVPVTVASYTMTVGAGGNGGGLPNNNPGASGSSSTLNYNGGTIVCQGGGGGGSRAGSQPSPAWRNGAHGGCGGGGSGHDGVKGDGNKQIGPNAAVPTQGYNGGDSAGHAGGGGGGGGANGWNGSSPGNPTAYGGQGGTGRSNSISGAALLYVGGGGGAAGGPAPNTPAAAGAGGPGGGGRGAIYTPTYNVDDWAIPGAGNTGSGGGGGGADSNGGVGAKGGSGLIVITYPT